jgi:uncharacterized protein YdhG (YjbR/CyaY superfamily)
MDASNRQYKTIDEYIDMFPEDMRTILNGLRQAIREAAPEAEETINYQMPTFTLNGNLVHFAAFKNHIGFYPTPTGIEAFKEELAPYKGAKGSVQFPIDQPLPLPLIRQIVEYRVKENVKRKPKKKAVAGRAKKEKPDDKKIRGRVDLE